MICECLINEVSVNLKGSSLRDGQEVERRDSEEESLSFWRETEGERESSRVSANWRTKGSEKLARVIGVVESEKLVDFCFCLCLILAFTVMAVRIWGVIAEADMDDDDYSITECSKTNTQMTQLFFTAHSESTLLLLKNLSIN